MKTTAAEIDIKAEHDAASRKGKILLGECRDTGRAFYYPRHHSPFTGGCAELIDASGTGCIYSFSIAHRVSPSYCLAYITLSEGPIILGNLATGDDGTYGWVKIGGPVIARPSDEGMPIFHPG